MLALSLAVAVSLSCRAQTIKDGYVDWGTQSETFHEALSKWASEGKVSDDDNFFISRVKPKERFRNNTTQILTQLNDTTDKRLIAWLPFNSEEYNALPDGRFDAEVFAMWPYVTHWGNWSCPLGRVPGVFLDTAHKNGVAVSSVADIPAGTLSDEYTVMIDSLSAADVNNVAEFLTYFGIDGLGYNSEFQTTTGRIKALQTFHGNLVSLMKQTDPLFENIWYDGTTYYGRVTYDQGLNANNAKNFGQSGSERCSLFLNYNWNDETLLTSSEEYASSMNRDPLFLYCGFNLQGGEPASGESWPLLTEHNMSIGLWGAHGVNMFWESRQEKGASAVTRQKTYRERTERFFSGGERNPAKRPEITSMVTYHADNYDFCGISSFITAHSTLCWNLDDEPFVTFFNLGNGRFFNIDGLRRSDNEWYNIGMQDYLPTWRWWLADRLLGNEADDVPQTGLYVDFTYADAYFGGSCISITGSTDDEWLHLLKTDFRLLAGDVVTVRYKLVGGEADIALALSFKGAETEPRLYTLPTDDETSETGTWIEQQVEIGDDNGGDTLALAALHFTDANNLTLLLGGFSIVRHESSCPDTPLPERAEILYNCKDGVDGKIIFSMPNDADEGEPCYNADVGTSYFRLYAQVEDGDSMFVGATTSWAALLYRIPYDAESDGRLRLGVSAVSLDMQQESPIAWSEYMDVTAYVLNDDIARDKNTIKPDESFSLYYIDSLHEDGTWHIINSDGDTVSTAYGRSVTISEGLPDIGNYDLAVDGYVYDEGDSLVRTVSRRIYKDYIQVTDVSTGTVPDILSLTANGETESIEITVGDSVSMAYTGRYADGCGSRGIDLDERRFGVAVDSLDITGKKSFSVTFWVRINAIEGTLPAQLFSVADKQDEWDKTDYGWLWFDVNGDGSIHEYTFRGEDEEDNPELRYAFDNTILPIGNWMHIGLVFDYDDDGAFESRLYVNGTEQEVTRWQRSGDDDYTDGAPGYQTDVYNVTCGQVLAVGGNAYERDGFRGAIDNMCVWDRALTTDEIALSMGDITTDSVADGLIAAWDMEDGPDEDYTFASIAGSTGARAGLHYYVKSGTEGQGTLTWVEPAYTLGSPFVGGNAYQMTTSPEWSVTGGVVNDSSGDSRSGEASLTFTRSGEHSVTLTLANDLGKDTETFSYIIVSSATTGLNHIDNESPAIYIADGGVYVILTEAGSYDAAVYSVGGTRVASRHIDTTESTTLRLQIPVAGVYILTVKKDGKTLHTTKIMKK